jgi:hypothetical protein
MGGKSKKQTVVRGQFHQEIETHRKALADLTPSLAAARVRAETIGRAADRLAAWAERLDSTLETKPDCRHANIGGHRGGAFCSI